MFSYSALPIPTAESRPVTTLGFPSASHRGYPGDTGAAQCPSLATFEIPHNDLDGMDRGRPGASEGTSQKKELHVCCFALLPLARPRGWILGCDNPWPTLDREFQ